MKKFILMHALCLVVLSLGSRARPEVSNQNDISITKIGSIKIDTNNRDYSFIYIGDVKTDENGNIYVLDQRKQIVQKYDRDFRFLKIIGNPAFMSNNDKEYSNNLQALRSRKLSINREFLYNPTKLWIRRNRVYILDSGKVSIYSVDGEFEKNIQTGILSAKDLYVNDNDELVILSSSPSIEKPFSIIGQEGNLIRSFGERYYLPERIRENVQRIGIDEKAFGAPISVHYRLETHQLYCMSPYSYEIRIYEDEKLVSMITDDTGRLHFFPPQAISQPMEGSYRPWALSELSPPQIFSMNSYLLVFIMDIDGQNLAHKGFILNAYKDSSLYASHKFSYLGGYPIWATGSIEQDSGVLFSIEREENSHTVDKYSIRILDGQKGEKN